MSLYSGLQRSIWTSRPLSLGTFIGLLALLVLGSGTPVHAGVLSVTATFDSSVTSAEQAVINSAINYYNNTFITAFNQGNVNIYFENMSSGLGQSNTLNYKESYQSTIHNLTTASSGDSTDTTALAHLPNGANNPVTGSTTINMKSANARALGFSTSTLLDSSGNSGTGSAFKYDGIIGLNMSLMTLNGGSYNLESVVEHEIDEVLGLGSDVGGTGFFADPAMEDLFRYDSSGNRNYTTSGDNAYFSLDGTNRLVQFNQDGVGDYGDWHPSGTPRVQDAYATPGSTPTLANDGGAEIIALDAIGYNVNSQGTPTPEPGSLTLLAIGMGGMGVYLRRRKTAKAA